VTGALDLLPYHALAEGGTPLEKERMIVGSAIGSLCDASKAVEIELPLKGREFSLAKVPA
jgi:hypothetical protein